VEYPQRLSRGLALVKWWLLAIPQYIIIAVFIGGEPWLGWRAGRPIPHAWLTFSYNDWGLYYVGKGGLGSWGLIGIVAVIAAVVLLVTGRYPEQIFDFVLGLNRWVLRVAGYAGLMTDKYPPFRLDTGGQDPGTLTLPPTAGPSSSKGWQRLDIIAFLGVLAIGCILILFGFLIPGSLIAACALITLFAAWKHNRT